MKKLVALFILATTLFIPASVHAAFDPIGNACEGNTANSSVCTNDDVDDPIAGQNGVLQKVLEIFSYIVGGASVIVIIISGLKFITANGDPNSIKQARNGILYAVIGIALFVSSRIVVAYIINNI